MTFGNTEIPKEQLNNNVTVIAKLFMIHTHVANEIRHVNE